MQSRDTNRNIKRLVVKSNISSFGPSSQRNRKKPEGPTLETLDYIILCKIAYKISCVLRTLWSVTVFIPGYANMGVRSRHISQFLFYKRNRTKLSKNLFCLHQAL